MGIYKYCPITIDESMIGKPIPAIEFNKPFPIPAIEFMEFRPENPIENIAHIWDNNSYPSVNDPYNGLEDIANANNLFNAEKSCTENVFWKSSVQNGDINVLKIIRALQIEIRNNTYQQKPPYQFPLNERGKLRLIKSNAFRDRIVQKSLNDNILFPTIEPKLIYDNSASRLCKGLDHARKRFKFHLQNAYRRWGYNFYVMTIDFTKYFDNIIHYILLDELSKLLTREQLLFIEERLKEFEVDVSYMSDEEYQTCLFDVFNSLVYNNIEKSKLTGKKFMAKSMGIGSQFSQISGLYYPYEIDNYCKIVRGLKEYGRYMDDTYIMLDSKEELSEIYNDHIIPICNKLGIHINHKKTHIIKVEQNRGINFLKLNYIVTPTSRIIVKVHSETFRRERRRIIKFRKLLKQNRITLIEILNCYKGWRGTYRKYDSTYKIHKLDKLFLETFPEFTYSDIKK